MARTLIRHRGEAQHGGPERRGGALARAAALLGSLAWLAGCAGQTPPPDAKVWSSSNSSDGYAACPGNTSVVGGGFEMAEGVQGPGQALRVIASQPHGNGWKVVCADERGVLVSGCKAWVVCASVLH